MFVYGRHELGHKEKTEEQAEQDRLLTRVFLCYQDLCMPAFMGLYIGSISASPIQDISSRTEY